MSNLKSRLQSLVTSKVPQAFAPKRVETPKLTSTGIFPLDALIQGFQRGGVTEIYGSASSGRTTIAISFLAQITRQQQVCAIVDASDSLDPESLAAAGADLNRVLWVRCGNSQPGDSLSLLDNPDSKRDRFTGDASSLKTPRPLVLASRHPRNEVRGLSSAVAGLMGNESPSSSQVRLLEISSAASRKPVPNPGDKSCFQEVSTDRLPPRRKDLIAKPPRFSSFRSKASGPGKAQVDQEIERVASAHRRALWTRLEQALKVTDLLLHNGGFGAVVLDLGDVPPANVRRIPMVSWFRFRRAIENTLTAFILLTCAPCAQTCASLVLRCERRQERWGRATASTGYANTVTLDGLDLSVEILRQRFSPVPQGLPGNTQRTAHAAFWQTQMWWAS